MQILTKDEVNMLDGGGQGASTHYGGQANGGTCNG